ETGPTSPGLRAWKFRCLYSSRSSIGPACRRNRVGLAGRLWTLAGKPCHYISNFLSRHRSIRYVAAPIRRAQFRPPGNYRCSKLLVTYKSEVRALHDRTGLAPSVAVRAMAGRTVCSVRIGTALRVAGSLGRIGRRCLIAESIRLRPSPDSSHNHVDLLLREHSTSTLSKGRHGRARNSF